VKDAKETGKPLPPGAADARPLCWAVGFVWLATGLTVLDPYYRAIGRDYLARLALPDWVMVVTCAAEVLLGLRVALGPASTWITVLQIGTVVTFTAILGVLNPWLLVNPFGMLSKNVPLLAALGTAWLLEREGWTPRALWLLRVGIAAIWLTEGIFPKILFQQREELDMVARCAPAWLLPSAFLIVMGILEAASGIGVLLLRGRPLRWLLGLQLAALLVLPLLAGFLDPRLWVHPFEPLVKNVPIVAGTAVLLRRAP
jgi:hypothetical protein